MRAPAPLIVSVGIFIVGITLGAGIVSLPSHRSAEAQPLDGVTTERVYRELSTESSPLQEGSLQLAKISAVTTPSVVHIQC